MITLSGAKTHFSLKESVYKPKDLIRDAKAAGYTSVAVADVNTINALPTLSSISDEEGVKLIFGVTVRVVDDLSWEPAPKGEPKRKPNPFFHAKLFARNERGLQEIMGLLTVANEDGHCYRYRGAYIPQLCIDDVLSVGGSGNIVVATGDVFSLFSHKRAAQIVDDLAAAYSASHVVLEITPANSAYYDQVTARAVKLWFETKEWNPMRLGISRPVLFKAGGCRYRNVMDLILSRDKVNSPWRNDPIEDLYILPPKRLIQEAKLQFDRLLASGQIDECHMPALKQAISDQQSFEHLFEYRFKKMPISLPAMAKDPFSELVRQAKAGWAKRIANPVMGYKPAPERLPEYKSRLTYELGILRKMGFENYFLLVSKLVNWSKGEGIMVGPGRGSAGGSLVSFLLGITDVDPIRFGLFFERFINPERIDLPDIDLDFMSSRREEVIDHLKWEYDEEYVACISNYGEIGGASAIRAVASAYGMTESEFECSKQVPKESGASVPLEMAAEQVADIQRFSEQHPEVWDACLHLEGTFRMYGQHAAGVIVAGDPIATRAVIESRKGERLVNWDKRVCEDFGLVKLDILGLQTLDLLQLAKQYVLESTGEEVDYTSLPLDDPEVMDAFGRGDTVAIFQFESGGMRHLLKSLAEGERLTFDDISAATALYRPGPIQSGLMDQYVGIKQGALMEDYIHESMRPALAETKGVIVYQEQVMQIARDLAGFSMAEADHLRKAMGKKEPEAMEKMRDKWVQGCADSSGLEAEVAGRLFDQIEKFAGYAFNKSHSVEYSVLSYWSMYMKKNHPAAFYAAALTILGEEKRMGIVKDAQQNGIQVMPPDINLSTKRFEIDTRSDAPTLIAPLQVVKGLSEKGVDAILEARAKLGRPFESKAEFVANVNRRRCNVRVQEALDKVGAFAGIEDGPSALDPSRLKDQKTLLPGLMTANVKADRTVVADENLAKKIGAVITRWQAAGEAELGRTNHPIPRIGRNPKIMIITDYPHWGEADANKMGEGEPSEPVKKALRRAGLELKDCYLTALVKCPKEKGEEITPGMIKVYGPFLDEEIEILNPPIIVALGGKSIRYLDPDVKGGWEDLCGQVHYDAKRDATIVFGMSPLMIHFDSSKQRRLNEVFEKVKSVV